MKFLELEAAYLVIAILILIVTAFVTTRPFSRNVSFKKIFPSVFLVLAFLIGLHFYITSSRMDSVETRFLENKPVICENRTKKEFSRTIIIDLDGGWNLKDNVFTNPEYFKAFHSARCLEHFTHEFPEVSAKN